MFTAIFQIYLIFKHLIAPIYDRRLNTPHEKSLTFHLTCHELFHGKIESETLSDIVR
jgi:hypothetical protein